MNVGATSKTDSAYFLDNYVLSDQVNQLFINYVAEWIYLHPDKSSGRISHMLSQGEGLDAFNLIRGRGDHEKTRLVNIRSMIVGQWLIDNKHREELPELVARFLNVPSEDIGKFHQSSQSPQNIYCPGVNGFRGCVPDHLLIRFVLWSWIAGDPA